MVVINDIPETERYYHTSNERTPTGVLLTTFCSEGIMPHSTIVMPCHEQQRKPGISSMIAEFSDAAVVAAFHKSLQ